MKKYLKNLLIRFKYFLLSFVFLWEVGGFWEKFGMVFLYYTLVVLIFSAMIEGIFGINFLINYWAILFWIYEFFKKNTEKLDIYWDILKKYNKI